jgi:hypothetical protein
MSAESLYELDMGDQAIDVSAATRKFQTSVTITQDPSKSGILIVLRNTREDPPANQTGQTSGGY